jgi:copper chaperone NosL
MLDRLSRVMTAVAALALLAVFALPLWRIDLLAPQYPEGIGMLIRIDDVQGVKPQDLNNINGLNHYIGMKEIHAESIPELRYMPWIVGALVVTGLLVAAWGRRKALVAWLGAFLVIGVAGLADFYRWAYDYGHDLDPEAIIKVPGMSYTPPIIGTKQLLNFTASSWPSTGGIIAGMAFLIGALALWRAWHTPRRSRHVATTAAAARGRSPAALAGV